MATVDTSSFTPDQLKAYNAAAALAPTPPVNATPTLTQAQLDTQNASLGRTQFNAGPISVAGLAGTTNPIVPATPAATLTPDISSLMISETPAQKQQDELGNLIIGLNNQEAGKSAFQTEQNNLAGVDGIQQSINDLNTSALQLKNDTAAAKLQTEGAGGGAPRFVVSADQANIDRAAAVKALTLSSLSDVLGNNLVAAQHKADQAVAAKFGPIEAQIDAYTKNLQIIANSPSTSVQEKNQATQLQVALSEYSAKVADQKAQATAILTAAQDAAKNAQYFTATTQYPTVASALSAIANAKDPASASAIAATTGMVTPPKLQFVSGTENQAAGYFNPDTGEFVRTGGGGSNGSSLGISNPQLAGIASTILASGKFTAAQAAQVRSAINSGESPLTVIKNQAKNIMGQTEATTLTKYEASVKSLNDLQAALAEYYENGGKTGVFTGNYEKTINNLGSVNDPNLVDLATQIQAQLQIYRNAVSGTAYSVQEGSDIASIFPGINKSAGLNQAIISGRIKALNSSIDGVYESALGPTAYNQVVQYSGGKGNKDNSSFVEESLTTAGINYADFISKVPAGKIGVVNNATGQVGIILPGEYNSATYTKL